MRRIQSVCSTGTCGKPGYLLTCVFTIPMELKNIILSVLLLSACSRNCPTATLEVYNTPILALKSTNHVAVLTIDGDAKLEEIEMKLASTEGIEDMEEASVWLDGMEIAKAPVGQDGRVSCPINITVSGKTGFALGFRVKDEVNLKNKVRIASLKVRTSEGCSKVDCSTTPWLRPGVALRMQGQDGVSTSRIPGLACSKNGTLIAMYDARRGSYRDLQGDIDICYNRSTDGGRSWSPMMTAIDMGEWGGLPQKYNGVSDGAVLADLNSGDIYIIGAWMYGVLDPYTGKFVEGLTEESTAWNHQWRNFGSQPGLDVRQTTQIVMVRSTDDGLTWSEPRNLTPEIKPEAWWLMVPGLGSGITMRDGTLVFPLEVRVEDGEHSSTIMWSKDGGETWHAGNHTARCSNECTIFEREDGGIMISSRDRGNRGRTERNGRVVFTTSDLGQSWTEHPSSRSAHYEPSCHAALLKHRYVDRKGVAHDLVFFFNPSSIYRRNNFTLKCSLDDGQTWPKELYFQMDENNGSGYSSMCSIDNDTIGILYEGSGADLVFQQFSVSEILEYVQL